MPNRKPEFRVRTFGLYTTWDSSSKELPRIVEVTARVPAIVDVEFGFVLNVRGGRKERLQFCIEHPGILDSEGNQRPPFEGVVHARTNDWDFYLGDTVWDPIADKLGPWRMFVSHEGTVVAEKTFEVYH